MNPKSKLLRGKGESQLCLLNRFRLLMWTMLEQCRESVQSYGYTNTDVKISLYVSVHIKAIPWKFHILNPKNSRVIISSWSL